MITVKNKAAIGKMTTAGALLSEVLAELKSVVAVGMTSAELNDFIELELKRRNLLSKTKGYMGYRHASCISVNDEVVHGVPSARRVFQNGDLVKVDVCASWSGNCADMARCFIIGQTDRTLQLQKMSLVAEQALFAGAKHAKAGGRLSDISAAIQAVVEAAGYGVVRDFAGHGIGKAMHEEPEVLNYGKPGQGPYLQAGMTLAIEPMITEGDYRVYVDKDGWTVKTVDQSWAAHVEDTILITNDGPVFLTRQQI